jgi:hypothetical protein
LDRVTYGNQAEGVSMGRLPDGTGPVSAFPGSESPAAPNYVRMPGGPVFNELMARNQAAYTNAAGQLSDWLELFNPQATELDVSGYSVSVGKAEPGEWVIPTGTRMAAGGYLLLTCEGSAPASTNVADGVRNLGRSLAAEGDVIHLFNPAGQRVDTVEFGFQLVDASIGRTTNGWRLLSAPTPGGSNAGPAALGDPTGVRINEWMADAGEGDDWLELYNPAAQPVDLAGGYLSDDPSMSGQTNFLIGPLTLVPAGGFVKWIADGHPDNGRDHLNFSLDELGESLRLNAGVTNVIDGVDFEAMPPEVSAGRWPDGTANLVWFNQTPTPGESNYLPHPAIVVNEILTHTDPPLEDAIEVHNRASQPVDLGGWYVSNLSEDLRRCVIPPNTVVPAGGFGVLYENLFNPPPGGTNNFTLNAARGDAVYLTEVDGNGALTGYRVSARVGAAFNGQSFGRVETSLGVDWARVSARTFGMDTPTSLAQFRTGTGRTNAPPWVGPVVISEVMYHPVSGPTNNLVENPDEEYVELHNATASEVRLYDPAHLTNTWRLAGGVDYAFASGVSLGAGETVLVVNFDPGMDPLAESAFRLRYGLTGAVRLFGPYGGQLSNRGEALELLQPDAPQAPPHPDAGYVPYVRVDYVRYGTASPWPAQADGTGRSLQRRRPQAYGNEARNWRAGTPTPGAVSVTMVDVDTDGDGLPDLWEDARLLNRQNPNDAGQDADGDGLSNLQEYWMGTDPRLADTDGDGLSDAWERAYGLDPLDNLDSPQDPDHDGLSNLQEAIAQTHPYNPDTDADSFLDGWEMSSGLDPLQPDALQADPDNDGMSNRDEFLAGTAPLDPASNLALRVTCTDTELIIRFSAQANRGYRLEYCGDAGGAQWWQWTFYAATPAAREIEMRTLRSVLYGNYFFRVVLPPQP